MKKIIFSTMIASLLALVGCQNEELVNETTDTGNGKKVTLTATIAGATNSRVALNEVNEYDEEYRKEVPTIQVNWEESGEKFKVYGVTESGLLNGNSPTWFEQIPGTNQFEGTLPEPANGYFAVYGDNSESDNMAVQYSLDEQDGTLYQRNEHYSTVLMYAEFSNSSPSITFQHMTAILKPTFKVGGNAINNTITQIVMGGVKTPTTAAPRLEEITIAPTSPATTLGEDIYIHLPSVEGYSAEHKFTFTVTAGGNEYTGSLTIPTTKSIVAGNLYTATIKLTEIPYVTFSSSVPQTLSLKIGNWGSDMCVIPTEYEFEGNLGLEYSIGGNDWQPLVGMTPEFGEDYGNLRLRGKCPNGTVNFDDDEIAVITFSGSENDVTCSGDIRTLINHEEYQTTSTEGAIFAGLFSGCTALSDASGLKLISNDGISILCYSSMFFGCTSLTSAPTLPAATLAQYCYYSMFNGCTSLESAPTLPATTLVEFCYYGMFYGCTSLESAPTLPATTLESNCYGYMFYGCTSLTSAPILPATTLAASCYSSMFEGCTSLTSAPTLPATTLEPNCYGNMFNGCTSLTSAPTLPATTLEPRCYLAMFYGCTSLESAPTLPATTLAESCYSYMFEGCSSLNSVTMLATDISAKDCLEDWLLNVASAGTFTKAAGMTSLPTGANGIPERWTPQNYVEQGN